jgi:hypothetical protein
VAYSAGVHETPENSPQHQRESARAHPNPHGAISEGNSEQFQKSAQRVIPSPTFPWLVFRVGVNKMACSQSWFAVDAFEPKTTTAAGLAPLARERPSEDLRAACLLCNNLM